MGLQLIEIIDTIKRKLKKFNRTGASRRAHEASQTKEVQLITQYRVAVNYAIEAQHSGIEPDGYIVHSLPGMARLNCPDRKFLSPLERTRRPLRLETTEQSRGIQRELKTGKGKRLGPETKPNLLCLAKPLELADVDPLALALPPLAKYRNNLPNVSS